MGAVWPIFGSYLCCGFTISYSEIMLTILPCCHIMQALINSFSSIYFVLIVMFLVFYMFSIFGMMLFENNVKRVYATLHVCVFACTLS
jgi:hypothetical protein